MIRSLRKYFWQSITIQFCKVLCMDACTQAINVRRVNVARREKSLGFDVSAGLICSYRRRKLGWKILEIFLLVKEIVTTILLENEFYYFSNVGKCSGYHRIGILEGSHKWMSFDIFKNQNIFFQKSCKWAYWHERAAFQRSSFGRSRSGGRLLAMT